MPHIRVFFCFQLNAGILKAVEIRMDIEIRADLKCSVFPNNQLFKSDNGKDPPQAINNIVDDFVWRIEFIIWADNFCQRIDRKFLFVIQNEIRQEQVSLVRFDILSSQCSLGADDLHTSKEIDMDILRIIFGGFCSCPN